MVEYTYTPRNIECSQDLTEDNYVDKASTSIDELDQIELLNRNADNYNQIITPDNPYPDILKKPLFTSVVPEGGILRLPPKVKKTVRFNPTKFSEMNIQEFMSEIADSIVSILNDLISFRGNSDDFMSIFTKDNRLLSIGILLVIISLFIVFFIKNNNNYN